MTTTINTKDLHDFMSQAEMLLGFPTDPVSKIILSDATKRTRDWLASDGDTDAPYIQTQLQFMLRAINIEKQANQTPEIYDDVVNRYNHLYHFDKSNVYA